METSLEPHYSKYNINTFPNITKPKIIGYFSINKNRKYIPNYSQLQYLKLPLSSRHLNYDLNVGFETVIPKPKCDEKLDFLLKYILNSLSPKTLQHNEQPIKHNFVCFRGLLRLIMCTPYENKENWIILATKFKGTIYLCAEETDEKRTREANETEKSKRFCYYGFKFETYFLSSHPDKEPETKSPVELSNEFCCMYETRLENINILYGAEMDGIARDKPVDYDVNFNELEFIELKVKRRETHFRQSINFYKYKAIKWWCQSFLVGIKRIIVGLRNDSGIVDSYEEVDLRNVARESKDHWSPSVCMKFCSEFLNMVKSDMHSIDCPDTVYRYSYNPQYQTHIKCENLNGKNYLSFLPGWYYNQFKDTRTV